MKKIIMMFVLASMMLIPSFSQVNGVSLKDAKLWINDSDLEYEKLMKVIGKDATFYIISFSKTPVGLKHCIEKLKTILILNDQNFDHPSFNDELYAAYVDGITDYGSLHTSLKAGSSEVRKTWDLPNNYRIALILNDSYSIMIGEIY